MLEDYRSIMKENWQSNFAGIMLPIYIVSMVLSLIFRESIVVSIIVGAASLLFAVSLWLVIKVRHKEKMAELDKCRNSFVSRYGEEPKTFKEMRKD